MLRGTLYCLALLLCAVVFAKVRSPKVRLGVLLTVSYALFASWEAWFALVLLGSTVMNFLAGEWLRRKHSALVLSTGIVLNLAWLSTFKYLPELAGSLPFSSLQRFSHLALPLGISFWTFQAMSYLFDIYQGEEMDPAFFEFATYMVFFPVTISGPICRMPDMLPQFRSQNGPSWESTQRGLRRIATGVLMMLLARLLGQGVLAGDGINSGFDHGIRWSGPDVWCLAFGYGLQLFFDFAAYSHVAIGAAQVLGLTVPENFDRPFQATSPSVFWTRWHMSLSFWIRDYVFLLLISFRRRTWWRNLVLLISMILFGLWHRASILFLLWGGYHGVLLVMHRQAEELQRRFDWDPPPRLWTAISWIATIALVSLGWIFFRANSLLEARQMLAAVLSPPSYASHFLTGSLYYLVAALAAGYGIVLLVTDAIKRHSVDDLTPENRPRLGFTATLARWRWFWIMPLYTLALLLLLIVTLTQGESTSQFMYRGF